MSPSPMHDLPVAPIDAAHHRRDAAPRSKEIKPLWTHEPLAHDRDRKPPPQPIKKRKRVIPTTPLMTFDPKRNHVPSGKQDSPASPSFYSRPSPSDSSSGSYDERQMDPPFHRDQPCNGSEMQKRPRVPGRYPPTQRPSFEPDTPYAEAVQPLDIHDSPVLYNPPPFSALSDQPPYTSEFHTICHIGGPGYVPQPTVHQDCSYPMGYCSERPACGYPIQYPEPTYGRPVPHGVPGYPDANGYSCPVGRKY